MQTRKDLLQAHRLMTQRAGLALVQGQPDTAEQPLRRMNVATFAGVMIAVLICAVFGIVGALTHSGGQLRPASGVVVMDSSTGTSYIWCGTKLLCPTVNYASARLAAGAGGNGVSVQTVSQGALTQYPHGQEIGIPGLPSLPLPGNLIRGPWSVCVTSPATGAGQQQTVTLVAGRSVGGQQLGASQAALVQAQAGQMWLIWNGQRLAIQPNAEAILQGNSQQVSQVPPQWLDALPKGPPFKAPVINGANGTTTNGPGGAATIGQVYREPEGTTTAWFVQLADGAAKISETQAILLRTAGSGISTPNLADVTNHLSHTSVGSGDLPPVPPAVVPVDPTVPLCSVYTGGSGPSMDQVTRGGAIPGGALPAAAAPAQENATVNAVWLPPNKGALIGVATGAGQQSPVTYFLVDGAAKYALASPSVAGILGYSTGESVSVPFNIADLIPPGPRLDPARATLTVPQPAGG